MGTSSTISTMNAARILKRLATTSTLLLLGVGAVMSAGCLPRRLVVWSPDASRAVVMDSNSTSLCDGDGKLARLDIGIVQAAAWMPDSKRVLLAVHKSADKWADLAKALDEPTRQAVIAAADELEKAILAKPADENLSDDVVQAIVEDVFEDRASLVAPALLHLRDNRPAALRKRFGEKWKEMAKLSVPYSQLRLFDLKGMSLKPAAAILHSLKGINEIRLAPNAKAVAFVTGSDRTKDGFTLHVAPLTANAAPRELADGVSFFSDWSADGQHVVYIRSAGAEDAKPVKVGSLSRRQVAGADGNLLAEAPPAENLATLVFDNLLAVRCLPDGRILFASADMTLPAAVDTPRPISLFAFKPGEPGQVTRVIPRQAKTQLPPSPVFDLSPNHKLICMTDDAKVCVVALADGQITWVQKAEGKLRALPSWRTAGELCFIIPATKEDPHSRAEVALWSAGKTRVISTNWPDKVMEKLTFIPSQKQPPTTAPTTEPK